LLARARAELAGFGIDRNSIRIEAAPALDWESAIARSARSARLTSRFRVEPLSTNSRPEPERDAIFVRPGLAFGDGTHPTTRLAARAIEKFCAGRRARVLDLGTGSGVLAFVAAKSGASAVVAIDSDERALALARHNARLNRLERSISFRSRWPGGSPEVDLVVANLEPMVLAGESSRLARVARRAKRLLVTGFLDSQAAWLSAPFARAGYAVVGRARERGWLLLALTAHQNWSP
jgi:ribosomal protein L11 methyltransferase